MGLRDNFQKLIERKKAEIHELEMRIRDAQSYLQALQDSSKLLPKKLIIMVLLRLDSVCVPAHRWQGYARLSRKPENQCISMIFSLSSARQ